MMRTFRGGLLIGVAIAIVVAIGAIIYEFYDTRTLRRTVRRGEVLCGVNAGLPGFSIPDDKGNWTGFDVDFCRAVAAAIFDDPKKIKFVPLDASERFKELRQNGDSAKDIVRELKAVGGDLRALRLALTGRERGPELWAVIAALPRDEALRRVDAAL